MRITLRQLELFVAIAKYGNITQAAEALYISQSAASMALAQLEKQLQAPLFERIAKKVILNNTGRALLPHVIDVLARANVIEKFSTQAPKILTGEVKIGASTTIGDYILPTIISRFINEHKAVQLMLAINNTEYIINELLKFNIDVAYIEGYCHHFSIITEKYQEDELIIFAAPRHPLACKRQLRLADLANADWILREKGSGTREIFEKAIYNKIDNLQVVLEVGSSEAVKQAVATGIGIACLSKYSLQTELKAKKLVALPADLSIKRYFYRLLHKQKYQSSLLQQFLKFK